MRFLFWRFGIQRWRFLDSFDQDCRRKIAMVSSVLEGKVTDEVQLNWHPALLLLRGVVYIPFPEDNR